MNRRKFLLLGSAGLVFTGRVSAEAFSSTLRVFCRKMENASGGRLGVYVLDTRAGCMEREFLYQADKRFPMCSVFKWLLAAAVLERVDSGQESLERLIRFGKRDLLEYSPVTGHYADGSGVSIARLCEAAVAESDNTAANLLLHTLNGPRGLTAFLRRQGDGVTRLDREEPDLNEARPGDVRDTTTPEAMGNNLRRFLLGHGLSASSRRHLTGWMLATRTSGGRLRSGLEPGWRLADKTGTGANGTANDVGIYWTPSGQKVFICIFLTQSRVDRPEQSAIIAGIGRKVREI